MDLEHTNRNVSVSHELQHEIALIEELQDRFQNPDRRQGERTGLGLCFAEFSALGKWGRTDFNRILTDSTFSALSGWVCFTPLNTHDLKGLRPDSSGI